MRLSIALMLVSMAGVLGGAWMVGRWALGAAIVADSVAVGVWALCRDDGRGPQPAVHEVPGTTLAEILERARAS